MAVLGTERLLKQFDKFGKVGQKVISAEIEAIARQISGDAKKNAPSNFGTLRQSIQPEKITPLSWEVVAMASYAGYVEFGTGSKVSVPKEMQEVANAIKSNPKGNIDNALDSIKDWCRAKGIDERAAWPILMSILEQGLRPRPFLFPAWMKGSKDLIKNLQKQLELLSKDFNNAR